MCVIQQCLPQYSLDGGTLHRTGRLMARVGIELQCQHQPTVCRVVVVVAVVCKWSFLLKLCFTFGALSWVHQKVRVDISTIECTESCIQHPSRRCPLSLRGYVPRYLCNYVHIYLCIMYLDKYLSWGALLTLVRTSFLLWRLCS